ncbi:hypothetical protein EGT07_15250 [Herbaspirillum sp. HC18]|nr:hypothetical protein EGT07_15250 [Herbaspirillum sp. HC18]
MTLVPLHWEPEPSAQDIVIEIEEGTGSGRPGEGVGDGAGEGEGAGVGEGAGDGDGVVDAYSQILFAPGRGSPNTLLLQPIEPVAVRMAHVPFKP